MVVGPVPAVGAEIGTAGPVEEPGRVQDHDLDAGGVSTEQTHSTAGEAWECVGFGVLGERRLHGRIARNQDAHLDSERRQRARQGADHVR